MNNLGGIVLHAHNNMIVLLNEQDQGVFEKRIPIDLGMGSSQDWSFTALGAAEVEFRIDVFGEGCLSGASS